MAPGKARFVAEARRHVGMSTAEATKVFETTANQNLAAVKDFRALLPPTSRVFPAEANGVLA